MKETIKKQLDLYKGWLRTSTDIAFREARLAATLGDHDEFIREQAEIKAYLAAENMFDLITDTIKLTLEGDDENA